MNRLADGRRREMADVNFETHGTLIGFEMRGESLACGAFEKLNDVRRGDDGGHAVAVKFHGMAHVRGDGQLTDFANSGGAISFSGV